MSSPPASCLFTRIEEFISALSKALTMLSGALLIGAIVLTSLSIAGRSMIPIGLASIPGDYELVEILCGLAVFAFMPYCQLRRGHISVDLLIAAFGRRAMSWTQLLGDIVISGLVFLILWRHVYGMLDKYEYEETTFILELPIWIPFAIALVLLILFAVTCLFTVWRDIRDLIRGDEAAHMMHEDKHP